MNFILMQFSLEFKTATKTVRLTYLFCSNGKFPHNLYEFISLIESIVGYDYESHDEIN